MKAIQRLVLLGCLLLTACTSSAPTQTPIGANQQLPTRLPTPTPTATPFALSAADYLRHGLEHHRLGNLNGARRCFTWAIQMDPRFAPAYVSRGALYLAKDDLDRALQDAQAALEIEHTAGAYRLQGEVLRAMGRYERSLQAFDQALARESDLREETFRSRWRAARALEDADRLTALGAEYASAHPEDPLRDYYLAWGGYQSQAYEGVIERLVAAIGDTSDQPAILWYLLGRSYAEIDAWSEAVTSLEAARVLVEAGDATMAVHTDQPIGDLFVALGRAYLGAGRCADAETMLAHGLSAGASISEHLNALEEARICQTPTPPSP